MITESSYIKLFINKSKKKDCKHLFSNLRHSNNIIIY